MNKIIVAIDKNNLNEAFELCNELKENVGMFKLGMEFFYAFGIDGINKISSLNVPIFLDLKLHDIPNTVSKSLISLLSNINFNIITVHASGGIEMMQKTSSLMQQFCTQNNKKIPEIYGVTVLTSTKNATDYWNGERVAFPFAMVGLRAINSINKLELEGKTKQIPFAVNKLKTMIKNCNNTLFYWLNLNEGEQGRLLTFNKELKQNKHLKHLNLELKCNLGEEFFYHNNFDLGAINEVLHLAYKAYVSGINGVVCSGLEVKTVKSFFPSLKTITPGIRPLWYNVKDDQSRTVTPKEAIKNGADYLVIGRPITNDNNPKSALIKTLNEINN